MRMLKQMLASVLCMVVLLSVPTVAVSAEELKDGDFTYVINSSGTAVTIVAYTGNEIDVVIPQTIAELPVTAIGESAFEVNTAMQTVRFPTTLEVIDANAFSTCTALTEVSFPDSLVSIGDMAFYNCFMLEEIEISPFTYDIGYQAFHNTLWLSNADQGALYLGRVLYSYIGTMPADYKLVVKNGTAAIAPYAFNGCQNLREVYLPVGIRSIGTCAFLDCMMMTYIRIPPSVTTIGNGAFLGAPATAVYGVTNSVAHTYAREDDLYFVHDTTLDYPDGDMNRDGLVNTSDFRTALQAILDPLKEVDTERLCSCDIVYDGVITTADVRDLMRLSLGLL